MVFWRVQGWRFGQSKSESSGMSFRSSARCLKLLSSLCIVFICFLCFYQLANFRLLPKAKGFDLSLFSGIERGEADRFGCGG